MCDRDKAANEVARGAGRQVDGAMGLQAGYGINQTKARQYTPLCVLMLLEMYSFPEKRSYYLYASLPPAQTEIMELLKRAEIVRPAPTAEGGSQLWRVDEDALRVYVDQVCRIGLPEKVWVSR